VGAAYPRTLTPPPAAPMIVELINTFIQVTDPTGAVLCGGGVTLNRLLRTTDGLTDPHVQFDNVHQRFSLVVTVAPASLSATPAMWVAARARRRAQTPAAWKQSCAACASRVKKAMNPFACEANSLQAGGASGLYSAACASQCFRTSETHDSYQYQAPSTCVPYWYFAFLASFSRQRSVWL
jgi:hypothetical protein